MLPFIFLLIFSVLLLAQSPKNTFRYVLKGKQVKDNKQVKVI